ncbi:PorP/SprF family type IX secretion system membrane protein [Odoribacter lunatus]|uniref:PorP/SprF family type IX secretion system membrane protein n=1 Tax=Odoribacter lunatus TaxID=2941335 RepID=UPI00203C65FD|nr:type IX secretion system membrane protein PorP/SprF [Odoribacter lunatus]
MRRSLMIVAFGAMSFIANAQQESQFSQNMYNHMTVNPAFAGIRGNWAVSGIYRNAWQKMEGAPETYAFNVDAPLRIKNVDGGAGISLLSDKWGMITNLRMMLNYSYKCTLSFGVLNVGARIGMINTKIEGEYYIPGGEGFTSPEDDPALNGGRVDVSKIMFDAGIGVFLSADKYYAGVSLDHLPKPDMTIGSTGKMFWNRNLFLTGGYTITLSPVFDVQPSVFVKTDFSDWQYSVNAHLLFKKIYWGGVAYRAKDAVAFLGGLELKNGILVGYSYDLNIASNVGSHIGGSHEVSLTYCFGLSLGKREKIYKSVRFL